MPHIWNNKLVVTEQELVPAWYNSLDCLQKQITRNKNKDYGIKKVCSGGNGRQLLVEYDSLPVEIKNGLGDPRKSDHLLERFYETEKTAVAFYTKHRLPDGTGLSLTHQEEYITNASVLKACIALKEQRTRMIISMSGTTKKVMKTILADAMSFNKTLKVKHGVVHTLPASEKRFKEVFKQFSTAKDELPHNYSALISGKLRNQNTRKVTDTVMQLLNDLFAGQGTKPNRTQVSREYDGFLQGYIEVVNPETGEMYNPKDYRALSDETIISYLGSWNEAIGTEAKRSGNRQKLMAKFRPPAKLVRPAFAGVMISVDDRQPPFEYAPGQRMWFYNAIDLGSGAFTGWVYGKSKEGIIVEFYRQLVRNYSAWGLNLPLELEGELSLNSSFTGTFLQAGRMFDHVRIEANNARGKRIERYYGELRYGSEKDRAGWLARPFALSEPNQAGSGPKQIIPYNDIVAGCLRDIEDWNNKPHEVYPKMSRWDFLMNNQHPDTKPTNWRAILPYLGYSTKTSCGYNGLIRLNGASFMLGDEGEVCTGQKLISLMDMVAGENIVCYWLDDTKGGVLKALVYYNDRIICEAVQQPEYSRSVTERTPDQDAARIAMSSYVSTIDAYQAERKRSINEVVVIDNTPKAFNSFKIEHLKRYEVVEREVENMGEMPEENGGYTTETTHSSQRKSLKDRL